jgi:hypothetical protein
MSDLDVSLAVRTSTPGNVGIDIRLLDIYGGYAHHQLRSVTYRTRTSAGSGPALVSSRRVRRRSNAT